MSPDKKPDPDLLGPDDLAQRLIAYRAGILNPPVADKRLRPDLLAELSDGNVRRLIALAYFASFLPDEGRYPRLRLFVRPVHHGVLIRRLLTFQPARPLETPRQLSELAPIVSPGDSALEVGQSHGTLVCLGVSAPEGRGKPPAVPASEARSLGLHVSIEAPGELYVQEGAFSVVARGGKILPRGSLRSSPATMAGWLDVLRGQLEEQCSEAVGGQESFRRWTTLDQTLPALWGCVLSTVSGLRKGGALVVVNQPQACPYLKPKYQISSLRLGDAISDFTELQYRATERAHAGGSAQFEFLMASCHEALFGEARSVAYLTAADGCVVLDRLMSVYGFGWKIDASEAAEKSTLRFVDFVTKAPRDEAEVYDRFGTRHKSAFELCKAWPNTLAFVISQDGDLRIFSSDDRHVYLEEHVSPH